jgi:hypothetical protein
MNVSIALSLTAQHARMTAMSARRISAQEGCAPIPTKQTVRNAQTMAYSVTDLKNASQVFAHPQATHAQILIPMNAHQSNAMNQQTLAKILYMTILCVMTLTLAQMIHALDQEEIQRDAHIPLTQTHAMTDIHAQITMHVTAQATVQAHPTIISVCQDSLNAPLLNAILPFIQQQDAVITSLRAATLFHRTAKALSLYTTWIMTPHLENPPRSSMISQGTGMTELPRGLYHHQESSREAMILMGQMTA